MKNLPGTASLVFEKYANMTSVKTLKSKYCRSEMFLCNCGLRWLTNLVVIITMISPHTHTHSVFWPLLLSQQPVWQTLLILCPHTLKPLIYTKRTKNILSVKDRQKCVYSAVCVCVCDDIFRSKDSVCFLSCFLLFLQQQWSSGSSTTTRTVEQRPMAGQDREAPGADGRLRSVLFSFVVSMEI